MSFLDRFISRFKIGAAECKMEHCEKSLAEEALKYALIEQEKKNVNTKKILHMCLDVSISMGFVQVLPTDKIVGTKVIDGQKISVIHGSSCNRYGRSTLDMCKENINNILETNSNNYLVSLTIFSSGISSLHCKESDMSNVSRSVQNLTPGGNTVFYDAVNNAILENANDTERILFVVFTDGDDSGSNSSIHDVCRTIKENKNVSIIIMCYDIGQLTMEKLKKIVDCAKFGKIMSIGSQIPIMSSSTGAETENHKNIDDAFKSVAKDLMIFNTQIEKKSVKDVFNPRADFKIDLFQ
jgi:vacuolar-type H+-ATPase subunit F/Vma7